MTNHIDEWLQEIGLGQYSANFIDNDIDTNLLIQLTDSDLKELGIGSLGHRKMILTAINSLSERDSESTTAIASKGEAEHRQLTVMFCDLADSTELSETLDLEVMRDLNRAYQDMCKEAIEKFGGYIAKYMGDGVLAYFGYPQAHEDDAGRAVSAGLEVVTAMGLLNKNVAESSGVILNVRVGIATGMVVVGDLIGEGASQENAVVGTTPNLAARIQSTAPLNTVAVSPETSNLTAGQFEFKDGGKSKLKGIREPVQIRYAITRKTVISRFQSYHSQQITPLVGRSEEVQLLLRRWELAGNSEGQVVLVTGEPGIGKSRLCEALQERILDHQKNLLYFQCSSHHSGSALFPIATALELSAGIGPKDTPEKKLRRLEELLKSLPDNMMEVLPYLGSLLYIPKFQQSTDGGVDSQRQKEKTLNALVKYLEVLAELSPLLCIFEDVHWSDPSTIELLDSVIERVESQRILLIVTYRPEFSAPWVGRAHVNVMVLNRLTRNQTGSIIESCAGTDTFTLGKLDEIVTRSDGIPLFIEELTHTTLEFLESDQAIENEDNITVVPATLRDSLMARLDRLDKGKQVAQCGSVIGREFSLELLLDTSGMEEAELNSGLEQLLQSGIVVRSGSVENPRYSYRHALLQDAAYTSLLKPRRKAFHNNIARALLKQSPDQVSLVAYHLEHAEELGRALKYRILAAEQSARNWAQSEAISHYWIALKLIDQLNEDGELRERYLEIVLALINVRSSFWEDESEQVKALQYIAIAIDIATESGNFAAMAKLKASKGSVEGDENLIRQSVEDAKKSSEINIQAEVARIYASFLGMRGQFLDSYPYTARAISISEELGEQVGLAWALIGSGRCFSARAGKFDTAIYYSEQTKFIAEETGDPIINSWLVMESEPLLYKGLWNETVEVVHERIPVAYENEQWDAVLWASAWAAMACIKLDRLADAQLLLEIAHEKADARIAFYSPRIFHRIALAQLQLALGKIEDASQSARVALEFCESEDLIPLEFGASYRIAGQVHAAEGDILGAETCYRQSLSILESIQSEPELAQTLLVYGEFKMGNNTDQAEHLLNRALNMFKKIDATGWIAVTKSALSGK